VIIGKDTGLTLKYKSAFNQVLIGWLGGDYEDLGFYDNKKDSERGYRPTEKMYEIIDEKFKGRKVKITIEIIE
jgi:hypothetical protein